MKKFASVIAALALAAGLSTVALAAPGHGPGSGPGYGPGVAQLTPEQQAESAKAKAEFLNDTLALRQKESAKRIELNALRAQPNYDRAKARVLADELVDLHAQVAKKRNEILAKYPNAVGLGMGGGMGGGKCGGGGMGGGGMMGGGMGGGMMGGGGSY